MKRTGRSTIKVVQVYRLAMVKERTVELPESVVNNEEAAAAIAQAMIGDSPSERLLLPCLSSQHRVIATAEAATSSSSSYSPLSRGACARIAIVSNASAVVLAHNHPSGSTEPSDEDRLLTARVYDELHTVGVLLLDHIIVTPQGAVGYVPFRDEPAPKKVTTFYV